MNKVEHLESGAVIFENDKGERFYYPPTWLSKLKAFVRYLLNLNPT